MGTVTISFEMTLDGVFDRMEHWFEGDVADAVRGLREQYDSIISHGSRARSTRPGCAPSAS